MVGRLCDVPCVNAVYVHQFGDLLVAFMTLALPLLKGYTGIFAFTVVYGIGDGIFVTTRNSLLLFTVDEKRRSAALGLGSFLLALGVAGGPPLAGKFVTHHSLRKAQSRFFVYLKVDGGQLESLRYFDHHTHLTTVL